MEFFSKKRLSLAEGSILAAAAALFVTVLAYAIPAPIVFVAGTSAKAAEVNQNFADIYDVLQYFTVDHSDPLHPRIVIEGANVQIVSGAGSTSEGDCVGGGCSGLGNLIVGYNESSGGEFRTGAHNVIVGANHEYTSTGGFVAGDANTISGRSASVSGGQLNTASGNYASISGGRDNMATAVWTSISGGGSNSATQEYGSVGGGEFNTASGSFATVSGGHGNVATNGVWTSVAGGESNLASGRGAAVSGGYSNEATAADAVVAGGQDNVANGNSSAVLGGNGNSTSGAGSRTVVGDVTNVYTNGGLVH
ncbi:MAG: hypothetical protein KC466_11120 [Myxococcales bacterium]|nr:hypothetical protein [Myxococcales bacterium]